MNNNLAELRKLDGKPSWASAFPHALQHVLAMLVGNITPPILIATQLNLSAEDKVILIQAAMIIAGITTLVQVYSIMGIGMGLPNTMGVAFAYMPILLTIGKTYGIGAIFGAQLVAALASILIGVVMEKIRPLFPPVVSGTVVLCIGLSLYSTAMNYMAGGAAVVNNPELASKIPVNMGIAALTLVVTLAFSLFGKGMVKSLGMLAGIFVGYIVYAFVVGIDFSGVQNAAWIALPKFLHFKLVFEPGAIIAMILMYIVQAVQTIGDVSSTAVGGFGRQATDKELGGAVKGTGVCGALGSLIGGLPTDPFSQNVGIIVTTKVVAKRVFYLVGGIILAAGLIPKFGGLMTTIPNSVLGGATVTVFAAITMSGIQLITEQPMNYRNKMIVGISLALSVGLTAVPKAIGFLPAEVASVITGSPIVLGFLISFVLNIIVPKDDSEAED
ncbi:MAG: solute carrier family 23 protein [Eubacteriales bacterium]|nr:solute carrier family 23 protein [Eubacteriales bacterium]